jgi:hypothetical protein
MSPAFPVGFALKNWLASRWFRPGRRPLRALEKSPFHRLPLRLEQLEDRRVPAAADLHQWSNLDANWQNGNLNHNQAILLEGDSVPYQDQFNGLSVGPGNNYVFTIQWQTTNKDKHALDYLTSYDYTWNGGSRSGTTVDGHALDGTGLPSSTLSTTFQIPVDPNINSGPPSNFMINGRTPVGSPTNPPDQLFTMYGATLTGVFGYTTYPLTGTTNQTLSISFTTAPTVKVPNPVSNPVLLWGGHIASQLDWGPGGAGSINGSPYHMSQQSLTHNGSNVPGVGSQDRQLMADAVISPTIIVVNKVANPALPSQDFGFTNTPNVFFVPGQPANFVPRFDLDGSNTFTVPPYNLPGSSGHNVKLLQTTTFGRPDLTRIMEGALPEGWTLTGITIHSFLTGDTVQSGPTATLNCAEGDTLWVTFTDTFHGTSSTATEILDAATGGPPTEVAGVSVFDTATVTVAPAAAFTPTGTVTYTFTAAQLANLTAPAGWRVVNPTTWTDTVTLSGGLVPDSAATPPLPLGSYQFQASYSGDSNYTGSTSPPEPLTIRPGSTSTATEIMSVAGGPPLGTLGGSVFDTATVTGSLADTTPTGTVTYTFTGAQLANLTAPAGWTVVNPTTWTDTVTLSGGLVPDSLATPPLPAGSYQFRASYNGDSTYTGSTSPPEPLTISQGTSSTATTIKEAVTGGPPTGTVGETVFDTATVAGSPAGITPAGTVTYQFFTTIDGTGPHTDQVVTLNADGTVPNSAVHGPLAAGSYSFIAVYSGDPNHRGSTSPVEPLTIGTNISNTETVILDVATHLAPGGVLGESVFDTATVTGSPAFTPTGTVTYQFFTTIDGTGPHTDQVVTLNADGTVPNSAVHGPLAAGSYSFIAVYSGGPNHRGSTSPVEPLTISQGTSSTATTIMAVAGGPPLGTLGGSVIDTATVSGSPAAFTPTGTVTYTFTGPQLANLTAPAGWTVVNPTTWTDTVTLSGRVPDSAATPPLPAGSYRFRASYSGDNNYQGSTSAVEPLTIVRGRPTTATAIRDTATGGPPTGTAGESVFDTATVTVAPAAFTPTGTVTWTFTGAQLANLTAPPGWTVVNPTAWADTVTLSGGRVPDSAATPPLPAGSYRFRASYSGDSNYTGTVSPVEPLTISRASPMLITILEETRVTLGDTTPPRLTDTAVLSGGFQPVGTITFTLFRNGTAVHTEMVTVQGNGSYTTPTGFPLPTSGTVAGTYQWVASYSGGPNNNPVSDTNADEEQVTVIPAMPTLTTTPNPTTVTLGANAVTLTDTATLSGGYHPTGDIVFELFYNGGSEPVFTDAVDVHGNGSYTTLGYTLPSTGAVTGTYQWVAIYGGDPNNDAVSDSNPAQEQVTVSAASIQIVKLTNGIENKSGTGPLLIVGTTVTWTYLVSNTGNVPLAGVTVTDDQPGVVPVFQSGDANHNGLLDPGETWVYTATGTVTAGPYINTGTASAHDSTGATLTSVTASDPDRYFGVRDSIPVVPPTAIGKVDLLASQLLLGAQGDLMAQADFVSALYQDVLGRPVDAAGVNYWVVLLQAGFTRAQVAAGIWESPEHRGVQVDALYRALLHRPADTLGVAYWGGLLLAGQSEEQVAAGILSSPEYAGTHPDAASFVAGVYADVLTRPLDPAGAAWWEGLLRGGASRAAVAAGVLASPEAMGLGLARDYAAYLRRPLDPVGWQYWMPLALATPAPTEAAALGVLASDAYFQTAGALART